MNTAYTFGERKFSYEDIKCFGESITNKDDKFMELVDGTKVKIGEDFIHSLWQEWIVDETAERQDNNEYVIFGFSKQINK